MLKFKKPPVIITVVALALVAVFTVGFAANGVSDGSMLPDTNLPNTETDLPGNDQASSASPANFGEKNMTLDELRALSSNGDELLFEDLHEYNGVNLSTIPNRYIIVYDVEGGYRLLVHSNPTGKPDAVYLESIWEYRGVGIDFRYEDIEEYLRNTPSREYVTEEQAWQLLTDLNDFLWGSNPLPIYEPQGTTHDPGKECWEFHINRADTNVFYSSWIWAVSKRSGAIYSLSHNGDEDVWFRYPNSLGVSRLPVMTLDDVRGLAAKGASLTEADLAPYDHPPVMTGIYAVTYPVSGGEYDLNFFVSVESGLFLGRVGSSRGEGIDIRYYDVDKYIADGTQVLVRSLSAPQGRTTVPTPSVKVTIEDRHGIDDGPEELLYEDEHYKYSLTTTRSHKIMLTFEDGQRVLMKDALSQNKISIEDLILNGLQFIIEPKNNPMGGALADGSFNYYPLGKWQLNEHPLYPSNQFMYMVFPREGELAAYFALEELMGYVEACGYAEQAARIREAYSVWSYRYVIEGIEYVQDSHLEMLGLKAAIDWSASYTHAPVQFGFSA